ncbi:MAG: class I SAM-dependent methyltransferase [Planctomycetaceae bacterium]|nr:class I SAM-dependent methyltransferase [Planctomycetaceae bacterium]
MPIPRTLEPEVMDTRQEAVDYDSMDHSHVNHAFVQDLLEFLNACRISASGLKFLDLGTGSALIPICLLQQRPGIGRVFAADLSREMLVLAQQHLAGHRFGAEILPVCCDAKRLPVPTTAVDVVISNSIVHHIPEPRDVFTEIRRCVSAGGAVFLRDLLRPDSVDAVESIVQLYSGQENHDQQQLFRQSLHAALTVDEVRQLAEETGFAGANVRQTTDRHWTMTWCAGDEVTAERQRN